MLEGYVKRYVETFLLMHFLQLLSCVGQGRVPEGIPITQY